MRFKDAKWKNFRHEIYSEYKATRDKMPDNLRSQITGIEDMIEKMKIDTIAIPWYEADDVIATLAKKLEQETDDEIYILSGDKDLYALVSEQIKIYDTQKKKISGPLETREKFWVDPIYVTDYLAICGDTSDNIPWVAGIGPKKVEVLINSFGTTEEIYNTVEKVESWELDPQEFSPEAQKIFKGKTFEKLRDGKENAILSKRLATLALDVEVADFDIHDYDFQWSEIMNLDTLEYFKELEFHSLLDNSTSEKNNWEYLGKKVNIIWDSKGLSDLLLTIQKKDFIVFDTETTSLNPREAELIWVSILLDDDTIFYINHAHSWPQVNRSELKNFIRELLESPVKIIGHNIKYDLQVLESFLEKTQSNITQSLDSSLWQMSLEL